jgi:predicted O-methyltransferase YrrM
MDCRATGTSVLPWIAVLKSEPRRIRLAGVQDVVEMVVDDALEHIARFTCVSFCFLDANKAIYSDCYKVILPNMVSGGILVADNAISDEAALRPKLDRALADTGVDEMIVPVGRGELVCRKVWKHE